MDRRDFDGALELCDSTLESSELMTPENYNDWHRDMLVMQQNHTLLLREAVKLLVHIAERAGPYAQVDDSEDDSAQRKLAWESKRLEG